MAKEKKSDEANSVPYTKAGLLKNSEGASSDDKSAGKSKNQETGAAKNLPKMGKDESTERNDDKPQH
jgi:hypothetical protein